MPGLMYHSPEEVVQQLLIDLGLCSDPEAVSVVGDDTSYLDWPVFRNLEPDRPDKLVKVSGTLGSTFDDTMVDSESQTHDGLQIMVRADDPGDAFRKINEIAIALDRVKCRTVSLPLPDGVGTGTGTGAEATYFLRAVKRMSGPMYIGTDSPQGKRPMYTVNYRAPFRLSC